MKTKKILPSMLVIAALITAVHCGGLTIVVKRAEPEPPPAPLYVDGRPVPRMGDVWDIGATGHARIEVVCGGAARWLGQGGRLQTGWIFAPWLPNAAAKNCNIGEPPWATGAHVATENGCRGVCGRIEGAAFELNAHEWARRARRRLKKGTP